MRVTHFGDAVCGRKRRWDLFYRSIAAKRSFSDNPLHAKAVAKTAAATSATPIQRLAVSAEIIPVLLATRGLQALNLTISPSSSQKGDTLEPKVSP